MTPLALHHAQLKVPVHLMLVDTRTNNYIANDMCLRVHAHDLIAHPSKEKLMTDSINTDEACKRELEQLRKLCFLPALCMLGLVFAPDGNPLLVVVIWLVALCFQVVCCGLIWRTASRLQRSGWIWAILAMGLGPLGPLISFVRLDSLAETTSEPVRKW